MGLKSIGEDPLIRVDVHADQRMDRRVIVPQSKPFFSPLNKS